MINNNKTIKNNKNKINNKIKNNKNKKDQNKIHNRQNMTIKESKILKIQDKKKHNTKYLLIKKMSKKTKIIINMTITINIMIITKKNTFKNLQKFQKFKVMYLLKKNQKIMKILNIMIIKIVMIKKKNTVII